MRPLRAFLPRPGPVAAIRIALVGLGLWRVAGAARAAPPLRTGPPGTTSSAAGPGVGTAGLPDGVTVVIPARDEADRIGPCLAALVADGVAVVVVDDGSTDATAAIAVAAGARVVAAGDLPPGWAGKARALQVGIEAATTPDVVCLDADTRPRPGAVAALVAARHEAAATLLTAATAVEVAGPGEAWLHPAMLATLVYRLGPPGLPVRRPGRAMANGQCMVLDRDRFLAAGGMAPVAGALVEDVALARHLAAIGERVAFVDGTALVSVAGYGSARQAWSGWGRSLDLAEVTAPSAQILDLAVVWAAVALPLPRLLAGRGDAVDAVALAARLGTAAGTVRAYRGPRWPHALSPLADVAVAARITWGSLRRNRTWRGRTYPA